jgi:hypothetical protein
VKRETLTSVLLSLAVMFTAGCFGTGGSSSSSTGGGGGSTNPTGAGIREGHYECWSSGSPRPMLDFKVTSGSSYTGSDGSSGKYSYDPGSNRLTFKDGFLDGAVPDGYHWVYHVPSGRPTASLRNSGNSEVSYCEWAKK